VNYQQKKQEVIEKITSGNPFFIDTNVLVDAAENSDAQFLATLAKTPNFYPTHININELFGITAYGNADKKTAKILDSFRELIQRRAVKPTKSDIAKITAELSPLAQLLPRSVSNHVVIKFVDSLIALYERLASRAASLTQKELGELSTLYQQGKANLRKDAEARYLELIDTLGIEEFDEKTYFAEVEKFNETALADIQRTVVRAGTITAAKTALDAYRKKTHTNDITFTATVISRGATAVSNDSDVRWLFTFYARRAA